MELGVAIVTGCIVGSFLGIFYAVITFFQYGIKEAIMWFIGIQISSIAFMIAIYYIIYFWVWIFNINI